MANSMANLSTYEKVNSLMLTVSGYVLFIMNIIVFYAVVMRYIVSSPPVWTTDFSTFMLLFITFIPAAAVLQNDGHIKVDFVLDRFGATSRKYLDLLTSLIGAAYFSVVFWQSVRIVSRAHTSQWLSIDTQVPLWYPFLILPIGCAFLLITFSLRALNQLKSIFAPRRK